MMAGYESAHQLALSEDILSAGDTVSDDHATCSNSNEGRPAFAQQQLSADSPFDDAGAEFLVLVNEAVQFSLWPVFRAPPLGWSRSGQHGTRAACLRWIETQWKDMRPRSLTM